MEQASAVVADLGSMADLISQVLEPAVSSHFRNAAQSVIALELYTKRAELAEAAKKEISQVLGRYHIESRDVMITDVVLPEDLTKPVRAASVAEQEKAMYNSQKDAQESRKEFEHAQKEAEMQDKLVESARSVEISKNNAQAAIETATGEKETKILKSEGESQYIMKLADANAHKTEVEGQAQAKVILRKGQSQAEAYRLSQLALGSDYARLQIIEAIAKNNLSIIPQNIIVGGEKGGGLLENFMGIKMIETLTGKPFNGEQSHTAPTESFIQDKNENKPEEDPGTTTDTPAEEAADAASATGSETSE
jgi:regulator of protease activity HflC (stomatin/prohibitin superfamily)